MSQGRTDYTLWNRDNNEKQSLDTMWKKRIDMKDLHTVFLMKMQSLYNNMLRMISAPFFC